VRAACESTALCLRMAPSVCSRDLMPSSTCPEPILLLAAARSTVSVQPGESTRSCRRGPAVAPLPAGVSRPVSSPSGGAITSARALRNWAALGLSELLSLNRHFGCGPGSRGASPPCRLPQSSAYCPTSRCSWRRSGVVIVGGRGPSFARHGRLSCVASALPCCFERAGAAERRYVGQSRCAAG
jgi:hypothetical protein